MGFNTSYGYRRTITVDKKKVPNTDQTNFPMLVSGTYLSLRTLANGGRVTNANGYDIVFSSDPGGNTALDFEIETYTATTGVVNFWVRIPTLTTATNTVIYMWYGNAAISTFQGNTNGTWNSNYKAVWHLPNGTSLTVLDSTSNANNGSNNGVTAGAGKVDGAGVFDGSSEIDFGNGASINGLTDFAFEVWAYYDKGTSDPTFAGIMTKAGFNTGFEFRFVTASGTNYIDGFIGGSSIGGVYTWAVQTWYHLVFTRNAAGAWVLYVNGVAQYTGTNSNSLGASNWHLGWMRDSDPSRWKGSLDEARISNILKTADYVATCYNNQNSPSTFYTMGPETTFEYRRAITIDKTKVPNTDQTNFPVLVSGTYSYLATVANGGKCYSSSGYDIIFTSDLEGLIRLDHEIETYSATTGAINFWVRVPTVATATNTVIYMWYANASVTTSQEVPDGVWDSNFKGVYHFKDGTTLSLTDSTVNNNTATNSSGTAGTGQVDGAVTLAGASDYVDTAIFNPTSGVVFTAEAWVKFSTLPVGYPYVIDDTGLGTAFGFTLLLDGAGTGAMSALLVAAGPTYYQVIGAVVISNATWYHMAIVVSGTTLTMYINGAADGSTGSVSMGVSTDKTRLGTGSQVPSNFNGTIDEFRYSVSARSADWLKTSYNNQNSPSTFYAVGAEVGILKNWPQPSH